MCGFLNLCRKNFTTPVQATRRKHLLQLGTATQERLGLEEAMGEPGLGCPGSLGSHRRGGLRNRFKVSLGQAATALAPQVASLLGPSELRRCVPVGVEEGERKSGGSSPEGEQVLCPLSCGFFPFSQVGVLGQVWGRVSRNDSQFSRCAPPGPWSPLIGQCRGNGW